MVSDADLSFEPQYDLARVQALAMQQRVEYAGSKVGKDVDELGLTLANVCDCICMLERSNFRHSLTYRDTGVRLDVYHLTVRINSDQLCKLFIKLKHNKNCTVVIVGSFHEQNKS
jgi:hypothetical protein